MDTVKKMQSNIIAIRNSVETIKDNNCIFIMKHVLLLLDDMVKYISTLDKSSNAEVKTNICKYCNKNETGSSDENILCKECQEIFGHSFFSEL